ARAPWRAILPNASRLRAGRPRGGARGRVRSYTGSRVETETIDEEPGASPAGPGARPGVVIIFACGHAVYRVLPLSRGAVEIGREELDAAGVPDAKVSGRHVRVTREDGCFEVRDLDSKNGTFVDGRPVQVGRQLPAPVLRIGRTILLPVADCRPFAEGGVEVAG